MKSRLVDKCYVHYQRVDRTPPSWADGVLGWTVNDRLRRRQIIERMSTLRLPVDPLSGHQPSPLEVVIVAAGKDFGTLPYSAASALHRTGHPIAKLSLIVPERDVAAARRISVSLDTNTPLVVISEDDVLDDTLKQELLVRFTSRYGWILQQLLCLEAVAQSHSLGVLVLDADTVITRPRVLLAEGVQVLFESLEYHEPYYDFLRVLNPVFTEMTGSHVTHHMVQQPDVLRAILSMASIGSVTELARRVMEHVDPREPSGVSLDYEFYAQGALKLFPERIVKAKWANRYVSPPESRHPDEWQPTRKGRNYCSISAHKPN
jgi:hypothetical protein